MRESSLRKAKWSPQIARDETRLTASRLTQRFNPQGTSVRFHYRGEWLSKDWSLGPGLASSPRCVLSKARMAASNLTSSLLSKCQVFNRNPRVPALGRRRLSSRASWRQDPEEMKMTSPGGTQTWLQTLSWPPSSYVPMTPPMASWTRPQSRDHYTKAVSLWNAGWVH